MIYCIEYSFYLVTSLLLEFLEGSQCWNLIILNDDKLNFLAVYYYYIGRPMISTKYKLNLTLFDCELVIISLMKVYGIYSPLTSIFYSKSIISKVIFSRDLAFTTFPLSLRLYIMMLMTLQFLLSVIKN